MMAMAAIVSRPPGENAIMTALRGTPVRRDMVKAIALAIPTTTTVKTKPAKKARFNSRIETL
ncbi:hypothetical protein D3C86_1882700 [compost metagenome]